MTPLMRFWESTSGTASSFRPAMISKASRKVACSGTEITGLIRMSRIKVCSRADDHPPRRNHADQFVALADGVEVDDPLAEVLAADALERLTHRLPVEELHVIDVRQFADGTVQIEARVRAWPQERFRSFRMEDCGLSFRWFETPIFSLSWETSGRGSSTSRVGRSNPAWFAPTRTPRCWCRPSGRNVPRAEVVFVHGLEGGGDAGYIVSMAHACLSAGFVTHRFHMRTCGGTEHLTRTLYHAGLTSDLRMFLDAARRPASAGLPGGLLARRERGAETGGRTGRCGAGVDCGSLRGFDADRFGRLCAAHRRARQPSL